MRIVGGLGIGEFGEWGNFGLVLITGIWVYEVWVFTSTLYNMLIRYEFYSFQVSNKIF